MQFQVPQFIETEDKIIGPLTLRQFAYVAAAGGISALLFFVVQLWLWVILSLLFLGAAAALAFVKIEGRSLVHVIVAALGFYWKPQTYVWREAERPAPRRTESEKKRESGLPLEKIMSGLTLHKTWQNLQTGTKTSVNDRLKMTKERYEIFRKLSGEKEAARRVDYR